MSNYLEYKGFYGTVEYSSDDDVLYGKVIGLDHSLISYEGRSLIELKKDFHDAVDDYLDSNKNAEIDKPCKGSFNVRIGPELHVRAILKAKSLNISLNSFIKKVLEKELENI